MGGSWPPILKALGVNFVIISASDVSESFREFVELNHPGRCKHFFSSIEAQVAQEQPCTLCKGSIAGEMLGCNPSAEMRPASDIELLMTGSPCDPFSVQRNKRFQCGNVVEHVRFDVTFAKVLQLYILWEPTKMIFEQVHGFTLGFSPGSSDTPKSRPGVE